MDMAGTPDLPFVTPPVVAMAKIWLRDELQEGSEPNIQVMSNNMRAVLNILPHNTTPNYVVPSQELVISWQLAMKIMLLKVGTTKGDKNKRHLWSKELGLSLE